MLDAASIKEIVSPICAAYGIDRLFLFGSYARNEANEDSDVDLRVDRGSLTGFAYGGFYGDIQRALGVPTDILTTEQLKSNFLQAIAKDEVLLYEKG
ncbi:MAG: nucleotidyltransferase domain-containing protein [Schwartzia sp.]|nr:nucleotidyltransferase domain-containing protein [Schwartzia sp. (in: firmicutes)]MBR1553101.1 nucleotidyltransferase domain-containing protein [Schwartzia sp. (in: firmicutes)]